MNKAAHYLLKLIPLLVLSIVFTNTVSDTLAEHHVSHTKVFEPSCKIDYIKDPGPQVRRIDLAECENRHEGRNAKSSIMFHEAYWVNTPLIFSVILFITLLGYFISDKLSKALRTEPSEIINMGIAITYGLLTCMVIQSMTGLGWLVVK